MFLDNWTSQTYMDGCGLRIQNGEIFVLNHFQFSKHPDFQITNP